ncbi:MAG: leucine-rich repeat protein [Clostridia bacterium]|nr:leucine-rich repeat protein [Clostridia bacterium]
MKNSSKLPIGVAIMLTMMAVGMQKGSILNATASAAETTLEESASQESTQVEAIQEESESQAEAETAKPANQELTSADTEKKVSPKQKTDKSVTEKGKSELKDANQSETTSEKPKTDEKSDEILVDASKEAQIKPEGEDKIEPENQVPKTKTVAKGNGKSVEENTGELVKKEDYNVEFTYDNLQYVLRGGTSVELREILNKVGLSGTPTNAVSSNDDLFTTDKVFGEWVVKSKKSFKSKETLSVTIDETVYNITVTDSSTGQCGENVNYTLDDNGTLTISGTGPMTDYHESHREEIPWYENRNDITQVIVGDGVTTLGNEALYGFTNLTDITLPNSLQRIGRHEFENCTSLENIDIPDSVTDIESDAFRGCTSLKSIVIPEGVTEIRAMTFYNCNSLESIDIPKSVERIGMDAFNGCTSLESIIIPDGVTEIGSSAFANCNSLATVTLGRRLIIISSYAFAGTPDGMEVTYHGTETKFIDICADEDIAKPFPNYENQIFHFESPNQCGEDVYWDLSGDGTLTISGTGDMFDYGEGNTPWYNDKESIKKVVIEEGVTSTGDGAFYWSSNLTDVTLPSTLQRIGNGAFEDCRNLNDVELPEGVTEIGKRAFFNCESFTSIKIPAGVTRIEDQILTDCDNLESVELPDGIISIGWAAFAHNPNLANIELPESLETIGDDAFQSCSSLENIDIPESVTEIGGRAFSECTSLSSVTMSDSVDTISDYAFDSLASLVDVYYDGAPDSLRAVDDKYDQDDSSKFKRGGPNNTKYAFHFKYGIAYENATMPDDAPTSFYSDTEDVELVDPIPQGDTFFGWYDNDQFLGDPITSFSTDGADSDKTFYAKWSTTQNVHFGGGVEDGKLTKTYGDDPFITKLEDVIEGTPSYSSSDPTVANINSSTGKVTIHKVGETTITGAIPATEHYEATTVTYDLTVNKADNPATLVANTLNASVGGEYVRLITEYIRCSKWFIRYLFHNQCQPGLQYRFPNRRVYLRQSVDGGKSCNC